MDDGTGLAEALLGLEGFRILAVSEGPDELVIEIETTAEWTACPCCGVRAIAHERMEVAIRDAGNGSVPERIHGEWPSPDPRLAACHTRPALVPQFLGLTKVASGSYFMACEPSA